MQGLCKGSAGQGWMTGGHDRGQQGKEGKRDEERAATGVVIRKKQG